MSKLDIKYIDNSKNIRDITAMKIEIKQNTLKLTVADDEIHYIPLCNIKEFAIKGYKTVQGE